MSFIYDMIDTWNNGATTFTALKMNVTDTASAAGSLLMDLQVGGVSKIRGTKAGVLVVSGGSAAAPSYSFNNDSDTGFYAPGGGNLALVTDGTSKLVISGVEIRIGANSPFGFTSGSPDLTALDTMWWRDAANTLAQRNGTAAQAFRLYNTFTDASNYERADIEWSGNVFSIKTANAGTGIARDIGIATVKDIIFTESGVAERWRIKQTTGNFQPAANGGVGVGAPTFGIKHLYIDYTNTATIGAVTINKAAGRVNIAAAGTSVVVTNSLVTAASKVIAIMSSGDATGRVISVVPAAGSFTINTVAVTAQTSFDFVVINAD